MPHSHCCNSGYGRRAFWLYGTVSVPPGLRLSGLEGIHRAGQRKVEREKMNEYGPGEIGHLNGALLVTERSGSLRGRSLRGRRIDGAGPTGEDPGRSRLFTGGTGMPAKYNPGERGQAGERMPHAIDQRRDGPPKSLTAGKDRPCARKSLRER